MRRKKKKGGQFVFFIITVLFLSALLAIAANCIVSLVQLKFNFLNINKEWFVNIITNPDTYFKDFFEVNPINFIAWVVIAYYAFVTYISRFTRIVNRGEYKQAEEYGSHGTARFQEKNEIKSNYYKDHLGWFLGTTEANKTYKIDMKGLYHPVNGALNMQMLVVGSPGSNKTTGFVLPNLLHLPSRYEGTSEMPDLIVTDPKSELYTLTSKHYEAMGYDVRVLDFIFLKYGDALNCLSYINSDKELMEIAEGYVSSVEASRGGGGGEGFWGEQEAQALAALMGAIKQTRPQEEQVMIEVLKLLTDQFSNREGALDVVKAKQFFVKNVKGAPLQLWKNFLMIADSDNTAAGILGGLAGKLKLFAIEGVQNISAKTTIDIKQLGRKKDKPIILYIFMPDSDRTFSPLINMYISTMFKQLYRTAYEFNNKLPNPVYFILEEMANIGAISGIKELLGTMRGRRIYPMMIFQSLAQMRDRYKDGWEDILSMCDTQIYLGVNDEFTAKYCSDALGNTTIQTQGLSQSDDGGFMVSGKKGENLNYTARKLMMPEEVKGIPKDQLVMCQRSMDPVLFYKVQYKYWDEKLRACETQSIMELPSYGSESTDYNYHDSKMVENNEKLSYELSKTVDINITKEEEQDKEVEFVPEEDQDKEVEFVPEEDQDRVVEFVPEEDQDRVVEFVPEEDQDRVVEFVHEEEVQMKIDTTRDDILKGKRKKLERGR